MNEKFVKLEKKFKEEKPFIEKIFENEYMSVIYFYLKKNQKINMHTSPSFVMVNVLYGKGKFFINNEQNFQILEVGDSLIYDKQQPHGFLALEDMIVQAVISPSPKVFNKINL